MAIIPSALRPRRNRQTTNGQFSSSLPSNTSSPKPEHSATIDSSKTGVSKADIKRTTRTRRTSVYIASFLYLVSFVFLLLILIGNVHDRAVLRDVYFYKLDLSNIIPASVPNSQLINSVTQTLGLHDFYQVGLWNYCEGYNDQGITYCSKPKSLFWWNPVETITGELLAGATIALPSEVVTILTVLRITSQIMFGFFLTGCILTFLFIFMTPLVVKSRWWSLPFAFASFIITILVLAASIIGSVISFVFKYAAEAQQDLNISASVGTRMFVFMWIATGCALVAFIIHAGLGCCCTSRRDITIGRRPVKRSAGTGEMREATPPREA
jgi:hypothetical protein